MRGGGEDGACKARVVMLGSWAWACCDKLGPGTCSSRDRAEKSSTRGAPTCGGSWVLGDTSWGDEICDGPGDVAEEPWSGEGLP